jgi:hypothetical protein
MAMAAEFTKVEYQELRQLAGDAWELELGAHLEALLAEFHLWKQGSINAHDLSRKIHEFHDGPAQELWGTYHINSGRNAHAPMLVASAVARGVLPRERLGEMLAKKLVEKISVFKA